MTVGNINPTINTNCIIAFPSIENIEFSTSKETKTFGKLEELQDISAEKTNERVTSNSSTLTLLIHRHGDMRNTKEIKRSDSVSSSSSSPSRNCRSATKNSLSSKSTLERLRKKLSSKREDDEHDAPTNGAAGDLERVFRYFDENGDGEISAAELESCVKAISGDITSDEAKRAVESSDLDGDGLLGFNDFVKLMEVSGEEEKNNDLKEAFKMYEMDGSGIITPKSLKRMLARLGESNTTEECRTMIRLFDLNGDGVLSFDEFSIMMV